MRRIHIQVVSIATEPPVLGRWEVRPSGNCAIDTHLLKQWVELTGRTAADVSLFAMQDYIEMMREKIT